MPLDPFIWEIFKHPTKKYHYLWLLEEEQDSEDVDRVT